TKNKEIETCRCGNYHIVAESESSQIYKADREYLVVVDHWMPNQATIDSRYSIANFLVVGGKGSGDGRERKHHGFFWIVPGVACVPHPCNAVNFRAHSSASPPIPTMRPATSG